MNAISEIFDDIMENITDETSVEHTLARYVLKKSDPTPAEFYEFYSELFDRISEAMEERSGQVPDIKKPHLAVCNQIVDLIYEGRKNAGDVARKCAEVGNLDGANSIYKETYAVDQFMYGRWKKVAGKIKGFVRTRLAVLPLEEVLPKIQQTDKYSRNCRAEFLGISCKVSSLRLRTFKEKGCICVECKTEGAYFAIERNMNNVSAQLELYGFAEEGAEVLFSKDHIHPKSLDGKDHIDNMQTMCVKCNCAKGNKV